MVRKFLSSWISMLYLQPSKKPLSQSATVFIIATSGFSCFILLSCLVNMDGRAKIYEDPTEARRSLLGDIDPDKSSLSFILGTNLSSLLMCWIPAILSWLLGFHDLFTHFAFVVTPFVCFLFSICSILQGCSSPGLGHWCMAAWMLATLFKSLLAGMETLHFYNSQPGTLPDLQQE